MSFDTNTNVSALLGKTLDRVDMVAGSDEVMFYCQDGDVYRMYHSQDCCESVTLEDVCGDPDDLIGAPIVESEEVSGSIPENRREDECEEWTFYKIGTTKGSVTLRWYGTSNGYYSTSVSFAKV